MFDDLSPDAADPAVALGDDVDAEVFRRQLRRVDNRQRLFVPPLLLGTFVRFLAREAA